MSLKRGHSPEGDAQQVLERHPGHPAQVHRSPAPPQRTASPGQTLGRTGENKRQVSKVWGGFLFNNNHTTSGTHSVKTPEVDLML